MAVRFCWLCSLDRGANVLVCTSNAANHKHTTMHTAVVTAVYDIGRGGYVDTLLSLFTRLCSTLARHSDLEVYVFTDNLPRVHVLDSPLETFTCWRKAHATSSPLTLPARRDEAKDTLQYLALMQCKTEMVAHVAGLPHVLEQCHTLTWLDAGIMKLLGADVDDVMLALLSRRVTPRAVVMPGCWGPGMPSSDRISWRFCGSMFMVAPRVAQVLFADVVLPELDALACRGVIEWEVNTWARAEQAHPTMFLWYPADHNARLMEVPEQALLPRLDSTTQVVIRKTTCDGLGNVLKGFASMLRVHDDVVVECSPGYRLGDYDTILTADQVSDLAGVAPGRRREYAYTCRLLVRASEEPIQPTLRNEFCHTDGCGNRAIDGLFSRAVTIDWMYDPSALAATLREEFVAAFRRISFRHDTVLQHVNAYTAACTDALGISVRTWQCAHESGVHRPYGFDVYAHAITEEVRTGGFKRAVLSVDTQASDVVAQYTQLLSDLGVHVLVLCSSLFQGRDNASTCTPLQLSAIKVLLLAKCRVLVGNRISTFTELVYWFSGCKTRVVPLY